MKVAVLHNLTGGGAHRRLAEQVSHLDAEVVEITTATAEPVTMRPIVVPLRPLARKAVRPLRPPLRYRDLAEVCHAWRRMGELATAAGADVVFANTDRFLIGAVDVGDVPMPVVRYCDEPRRVDYEPEVARFRNPATRLLYRDLHRRETLIDRSGVLSADLVLTNSSYTARRIESAYGVRAEVVVSGVPPMMVADGPAEPPHLLSVGRLIPSKGHDLVIEAAARSGLGLPVVIVAHRDDVAERERLSALARERGVRVAFRLGISDEQLARQYRGAVALLYLSEREPLGLASLEAQACGCPVIVADEGGLPETVRDTVGGVVVRRDAEAAAVVLRRLAEVPTRVAPEAGDLQEASGWVLSAFELSRHFAAVVRAAGPVAGRGSGAVPVPVPRSARRDAPGRPTGGAVEEVDLSDRWVPTEVASIEEPPASDPVH